MTTTPDTSIAIEFLKNWKPEGPWVLCAFDEEKKGQFGTFGPDNIEAAEEWLAQQHAAQTNTYFHCNTVRPNCGKAKKTDVQSVDWLHVDVDPEPRHDLRKEQARILKLLQTNDLLPKPTVIIFSGGGYQCFWKLSDPIMVDGDESKAQDAERYNEQIQILLMADSCHNVDRIMRLPGSVNFPNKKKRDRGQEPVMADVVSANWETSYGLDEFTKATPRMGKGTTLPSSPNQIKVEVSDNIPRVMDLETELPGVTARCKVAIVNGHDPDQPLTGDNSRSEWLFYVVCELVRHDVSDEMIYSIITDPDFDISASVLDKGNPSSVKRYALRQIQRAKEHNEEPWLEKLNRVYAAIESVGGKFRIACERYDEEKGRYEIEFHLLDGFKTTWCNKMVEVTVSTPDGTKIKQIPVGKYWLEHPNRREYSTVTFHPNKEFSDKLNLWRGFAYDAIPGDWGLFEHHIRQVLCKGNETYSDYLLGWMANAVQNPAEPGQVAIVMRGGQGVGKGTFAKVFGKLFGTHYKYVSNPEHITGKFNFMLHDAVAVFADECFAAKDKKSEAALKALITEETLRVEPKNIDNMEARNCVHLIMATNKDWAVSADMDDRRFFVLEVDDTHRVDTVYFGKMLAQMEAGGFEALMHYLVNYDLSDFDVRNCPKTDELRHQQDQSMRGTLRGFLLEKLQDGQLMPSHHGWRGKVIKEEFLDAFQDYSGDRITSKTNITKLIVSLYGAEWAPGTRVRGGKTFKWHTARGQEKIIVDPHFFTFPPLDKCRAMWDENLGTRDWPSMDPETADDYIAGPPPDGDGAF